MGSTGSGSFTDYSGANNPNGIGGAGGASGTDRCALAFSCSLQEVALCDFYRTHRSVPPVGTPLSIVLNGRLFAADANGMAVGALPTAYNYLAACLEAGFKYVGVVTTAAAGASPIVSADFRPA